MIRRLTDGLLVGLGLTIVLSFAGLAADTPRAASASALKVRTYYVAADEVEWDYAPGGLNKMMGTKLDGHAKSFAERSPHRVSTVYRKTVCRGYTDQTF